MLVFWRVSIINGCRILLNSFTTSISQSVQLLSHVRLFVTPWTAAHPASLSITNSPSLFKLVSIESVIKSQPRVSSLLPPGISSHSVAFLSYILDLQTSYILQITEASSKEYSQRRTMRPIPFGVGRPVVTIQGGQPYKKGRLGNAGPGRYKIFKTL